MSGPYVIELWDGPSPVREFTVPSLPPEWLEPVPRDPASLSFDPEPDPMPYIWLRRYRRTGCVNYAGAHIYALERESRS